MTRPAISVLMPAYNGGDFVIEAVAGALDQMGPEDELLIQDGGSTDGSVEALQTRFGDRPQLSIVSGKDGGQADALNKALARAKNPIIGWLNADDCLYPGALEAVRDGWERQPGADIVYGSWRIFDNSGTVMRDVVPKEFTLTSIMWQPHVFSGAIFFRRDLVRDSGGFDADLYMCMDLDLVLRLAAADPTYVKVPETLAGFRWHDDSKTGAIDFRVVSEAYVVRRRYSHGLKRVAFADLCSLIHLVVWCLTPLRRAKWYSRLRVRRAERRG
ncbi:glycosyltransferase family 2 protein [Jatrophihabitans sp.]|uniref:glycosyltransferase family 2 protein n=1 Tax=Jatrophihabitans sp. TaxID=1932789 RepID=UPI0030C73130|nr:glycosyl transferase family 2 [Jatrophihabitans sp.]